MSILLNNEEYLTIKELAEQIGYTPQALYKKINNPLNPLNKLVKTVKSVKYLPKSCISVISEEVENLKPLNDLNHNLNSLNNESIYNSAPDAEQKQTENTDISKAIIEMLKNELEVKNKHIEELNNRLSELTNTLQREQELNRIQQEINAKNLLLLESKENKRKGIFKRIFKGKKENE